MRPPVLPLVVPHRFPTHHVLENPRGVPRKRRKAGAVRLRQFFDRGIAFRELLEPVLRSVPWYPGSDARPAGRQSPGLLIRRPPPTHVVVRAITKTK